MHHLQPLIVAILITCLAFSENLCWDLQVVNEVDEIASASVDPPPKKMTPRKKQLATKVRKSPANKKKK